MIGHSGEPATDGVRVLVVEDDEEMHRMLMAILSTEGYDVDSALDGRTGLQYALVGAYHVLIIDRGLPVIDGFDLTARLRERGVTTPVLILTGYSSIADRVAGLDAGAEDYLIKPFDVDELLARLRALVRRRQATTGVVNVGAGVIDLLSRTARRPDGVEVELSGRECAFIRLLLSRPGRVFDRAELRAQIFGNSDSDSIVDTYVHYIRRKLGRNIIRTMRGYGYRIGSM
jgi:two-component system response regulator QseB